MSVKDKIAIFNKIEKDTKKEMLNQKYPHTNPNLGKTPNMINIPKDKDGKFEYEKYDAKKQKVDSTSYKPVDMSDAARAKIAAQNRKTIEEANKSREIKNLEKEIEDLEKKINQTNQRVRKEYTPTNAAQEIDEIRKNNGGKLEYEKDKAKNQKIGTNYTPTNAAQEMDKIIENNVIENNRSKLSVDVFKPLNKIKNADNVQNKEKKTVGKLNPDLVKKFEPKQETNKTNTMQR